MRVRIHSECTHTPHAHTPLPISWREAIHGASTDAHPPFPASRCFVRLNVRKRSFRMSKHDLEARRIYHHTRESIEAHVTIVFAAHAASHRIEHQTGWSIKKFVHTARRHRTMTIQAGRQTLTAAESLPDDLAGALARIHGGGAH